MNTGQGFNNGKHIITQAIQWNLDTLGLNSFVTKVILFGR